MQSNYSCPECKGSMKGISKDDLEFEACTACGGFWFDFGELKEAIAWEEAEVDLEDEEDIFRGDDESDHGHHFNCIKCDIPMEEREYAYDSGIHIDGCSECKGIFVSADDLDHIRQFLHSSKNSVEAKDAHYKAQLALNQVAAEYQIKQASLAQEIDNLFQFDDIKPINGITEWLIEELVDVDSFHLANR